MPANELVARRRVQSRLSRLASRGTVEHRTRRTENDDGIPIILILW